MPIRPLLVLSTLALLAPTAFGQANRPDPFAARREMGPQSYTWQAARAPDAAPGLAAGVPTFGEAPRLAAQAAARRAASRGVRPPTAARPATKPFNTVVHQPTISPYLHLYREEEEEAAPNYFAFVRPQLDQLERNREQAAQMQALERQVRQAAFQAPAQPAAYSGPARYGETSHFYGGWRK